jgi:hypothetical protein
MDIDLVGFNNDEENKTVIFPITRWIAQLHIS